MDVILGVAAALLGLAVGSFINVLAYRVPLGKSVISPPSHCPHCETPIRVADNIPVWGWVKLRGRCRHCGEPFSVRYLIVELGTAAAFIVTVLAVGLQWVLPAFLWFVGVTIALILTDLDHHRIPNRILYPSTGIAVVLLALGAWLDGNIGALPRAFGGGAIYFGLLFVVALIARGGFGFGDVKLAFLLGWYLGYLSWSVLGAGIFLAILIGGLVSVVLLVSGRRGRKDAIPFGPPLVLGAWTALLWGQQLADWYLG